jgi:hypothetical protein
MTTTANSRSRRAGERVELRRYRIPAGERILYGQHVDGQVALVDAPAGDQGRVYLLERHVDSKVELDGIVSEYAERSERLGEPALLASRRLGDQLLDHLR